MLANRKFQFYGIDIDLLDIGSIEYDYEYQAAVISLLGRKEPMSIHSSYDNYKRLKVHFVIYMNYLDRANARPPGDLLEEIRRLE